MFHPLDGPSIQGTLSVTDLVVQEVKVGANPLEERQVISIQPIDGNVYIYFGDGVNIPTVSDLQNKGFLHIKKAKESYEAGDKQKVYILATSGTVNVRFAERA